MTELLTEELSDRFPGLWIDGDAAVVEAIDRSRADIMRIRLSTPKQERWMADHVGRLRAPVLVGVGAAFDFERARRRRVTGGRI